MRSRDLAAISLAAAIALAAPAAQAWSLRDVARLTGLVDLVPLEGGGIAALAANEFRRVSPLPPGATPPPIRPRAGPPAQAVEGDGEIRRAELIEPTDRYRHRVLGRFSETAAMRLRLRDGSDIRFALPADSVFEDVRPRLYRIGGADHVVTVRSYLDRGSALIALARGPGGLAVAAESAAVGTPHRWLNPIGMGDFLGIGRPQFAAIVTPHIAGTLVIYEFRPGHMPERFRQAGYSNHALGSEVLGLHAIADLDGDGTDDLILPDRARRTLVLLSVAKAQAGELARLPLPAPVAASIVPEGAGRWLIGLSDGRILRLAR